jgi:hypothetical protein
MPSIDDVFTQLLETNTHLQQLHTDLVGVTAATDAVKGSVDQVVTNTAEIVVLEKYATQALNQLSQQADTIICILEHVSKNTCSLVMRPTSRLTLRQRSRRRRPAYSKWKRRPTLMRHSNCSDLKRSKPKSRNAVRPNRPSRSVTTSLARRRLHSAGRLTSDRGISSSKAGSRPRQTWRLKNVWIRSTLSARGRGSGQRFFGRVARRPSASGLREKRPPRGAMGCPIRGTGASARASTCSCN